GGWLDCAGLPEWREGFARVVVERGRHHSAAGGRGLRAYPHHGRAGRGTRSSCHRCGAKGAADMGPLERLYGHLFMVGVVGSILFGTVAFFVCLGYMLEAGWDTGTLSVSLFTFVLSAWIVAPVLLYQGYWLPFITVYLLLGPCLLMVRLFMD